MPSQDTYRNFFGSMPEALRRAGIPETAWSPGQRAKHRASQRPGKREQYLLDALRHFYRRTGRAPTRRDLGSTKGIPDQTVYHRAFGGLLEALRRAGIPETAWSPIQLGMVRSPRERKQREQYLLDSLRHFYRRTGRAPTWSEFDPTKGMPGRNSYRRVFGSLREALRRAGIPKEAWSTKQRNWLKCHARRRSKRGKK